MILINLFLVSILWIFIRRVFWKRKSATLNCGIWGVNCAKGRKPDLRKLLILGLYNRTRGVDSCGYYYNGNVVKGIDKEADFKDFILKNKFEPGDLPFNTVMCHARKSTYGGHTENNAHPHVIDNHYVQTHNGTLKNIWALTTKYDIEAKSIFVDSIGLAEIINKIGFSVLNEYTGAAALSMVFMDDPETLYLYHGASKEKKDGSYIEERPLYYLKTPEGLYYSSMEESLQIVNTTKNQVMELKHNEVFKIQNGELIESVYHVEREFNNVAYTYVAPTKDWSRAFSSNKTASAKEPPTQATLYLNSSHNASTTDIKTYAADKSKRGAILKENIGDIGDADVYFRYGRFHTRRVEFNKGILDPVEYLLHGIYQISRKGEIIDDVDIDSKEVVETYYFVRGIMMKNIEDYRRACNFLSGSGITGNFAAGMSWFSRYPITTYFDEGLACAPTLSNLWFSKGNRFDGTFTPKFTKRRYQIKEGYFHSIGRPSEESDKALLDEIVDINVKLDDSKFLLETNIKKVVDEWSEKIITADNIKDVPDCFFLMIEEYITADQKKQFTDDELFNLVYYYANELIERKVTFRTGSKDFFSTALNLEDMVNSAISVWGVEYLLTFENRFQQYDFEMRDNKKKEDNDIIEDAIIIDEDDEEPPPFGKSNFISNIKGITEQAEIEKKVCEISETIKQLEDMTDNLQLHVDSTEAQNIAFSLFSHIEDLKKQISQERIFTIF